MPALFFCFGPLPYSHKMPLRLGLAGLEKTRILIRYDVENISDDIFEKACRSVFSEPPVDDLYLDPQTLSPRSRVLPNPSLWNPQG